MKMTDENGDLDSDISPTRLNVHSHSVNYGTLLRTPDTVLDQFDQLGLRFA